MVGYTKKRPTTFRVNTLKAEKSEIVQEVKSIEKLPSSTPVAILTDDHTGSSGEATLLCFRGLDNARTFGMPTAGYASANITKFLLDGYMLVITTASDMARTGEIFCDDPIEPDVRTETPLEDAAAWIGSLSQK